MAHPVVHGLVAILEAKGMTQRDVCRRAGYGPNQISSWTAGNHSPRLATISDLLEAVGYELKIVPKEDNDD